MRTTRRRAATVLALGGLTLWLASHGVQAQDQDQPQDQGTVWVVDFVKTKNGLRDDYLKYVETNWASARAEMVKQGTAVSYQVLESPTASRDWDVLLMTEYASMTQFNAREESYVAALNVVRPNNAPPTPVNGRGMRDLADVRFTTLLRAPIRAGALR